MSHVREGEIHAYLDGALDRLGETRASEVRRHVDGCEDCRSRLEEERRVRDLALQLLDSGAPASFEMPPFEEILRRAEAGPVGSTAAVGRESGVTQQDTRGAARRSLGRTQRWAWAASLVAALGTGWLLRGSEIPQVPASDRDNAAVAVESPGRLESEEVDPGFAPVRRAAEGESTGDAGADRRVVASQAERTEMSAATEEVRQRSVSFEEANVQSRTPDPVGAGALAQAAADTSGARDRLGGEVFADSAESRVANRPAEERVLADEFAERTARESLAAAPEPREDASIGENERVTLDLVSEVVGGGLGVVLAPELPVVGMSSDSGSVRVVQLFPEGDTLVLEFTGVEGAFGLLEGLSSVGKSEADDAPAALPRVARVRGSDADAPASLDEPFVSEVRISKGSGLLVVRSQRPQSELEALLRSWGMLNP